MIEGVVEFVEGVAQFDAGDEDFKAVDVVFVLIIATGERTDARGVFVDKGGLDEGVLDALLKDFHEKVAVGFSGDVVAGEGLWETGDGVLEEGTVGEAVFGHAEGGGDGLPDAQTAPCAAQLDLVPVPRDGRRLAHVEGYRLDHFFDEIHEDRVGAVRHVELHRRELGVVTAVAAFVAIAAVEFKDALESADDEAFEVEFGGDAHVHVEVEGVVMGLERTRRGAARLDLEDGRLDLKEPVFGHVVAQFGRDERALVEDVAHIVVDDQVEVALAIPGFGVGQAVEFFGQRTQALRQQLDCADAQRQLARFGDEESALGPDDVADVEFFEPRVFVGADGVARDKELNRPGGVLDDGKRAFAHVADCHDPAGQFARHRIGLKVGLGFGRIARLQIRRMGVGFKPRRVNLNAFGAECVHLFNAPLHDGVETLNIFLVARRKKTVYIVGHVKFPLKSSEWVCA